MTKAVWMLILHQIEGFVSWQSVEINKIVKFLNDVTMANDTFRTNCDGDGDGVPIWFFIYLGILILYLSH